MASDSVFELILSLSLIINLPGALDSSTLFCASGIRIWSETPVPVDILSAKEDSYEICSRTNRKSHCRLIMVKSNGAFPTSSFMDGPLQPNYILGFTPCEDSGAS